MKTVFHALRHTALIAALLLAGCGDDDVVLFDAGPRPDAPPAHDGAVGVFCKGADCAEGLACCREILDRPPPVHFCIPDPDVCFGATLLCDGPEDCADGEICCSDAEAVHCVAPGECGGLTICHTNEGCQGLVCCNTATGVVKACAFACS